MRLLNLDAQERPKGKTVVCLGFFDGVHRGHAQLVRQAMDIASANGWLSCVHTFAQMPIKIIKPSLQVLEITPLTEKARLLHALGVDIVAVSRFDSAMASMHAKPFFENILLDQLHAAHIVAGFHHRFGYHSEADTKVLAELCNVHGVGLTIVPPVRMEDGLLVSSTAIRTAIEKGDMVLASSLLGRPYTGPA